VIEPGRREPYPRWCHTCSRLTPPAEQLQRPHAWRWSTASNSWPRLRRQLQVFLASGSNEIERRHVLLRQGRERDNSCGQLPVLRDFIKHRHFMPLYFAARVDGSKMRARGVKHCRIANGLEWKSVVRILQMQLRD